MAPDRNRLRRVSGCMVQTEVPLRGRRCRVGKQRAPQNWGGVLRWRFEYSQRSQQIEWLGFWFELSQLLEIIVDNNIWFN